MLADAAEIVRLAERVEQATGPDRGLDADIAHVVGHAQRRGGYLYAWCEAGSTKEIVRPPAYTASLDAAMTLIPSDIDASGERFRLEEYTTNGVLAEHVRASAWVPGAQRVYAATPALALTAACLRARARAAQHDHEVG